jgi:trehalose 6-phosphate synthase
LGRLVIVSNRVTTPSERPGRAGGLAVAMRDTLRKHGGVWFGWSGKTVRETPQEPRIEVDGNVTFATLDLGSADHDQYYAGFSNSTLWPVLHYQVGYVEYRRESFAGYMRVNTQFARALLPLIEPDDVIWVHDYHFFPFGNELRKLGVTNRIGFFLHTPFPTTEVLTCVPQHQTLVNAMCSYDLIGFQTENDMRALKDYIVTEIGGNVHASGIISAFGRRTRACVFPIGIDTEEFVETAVTAGKSRETKRMCESLRARHLIIGVDRLDYSKGIPRRFDAFRELLNAHPDLRSKVTLMQIAPPSRSEVSQYQELRKELEQLAGNINGEFAEFDWVPIRYLNKSFTRQMLAGFYRISRVGLVTPLRDGMNLVAKEYVASQNPDDPGVLVLSRFAGAARELDSALIVNPFDIDQMMDAIRRALSMSREERLIRWERMMEVITDNTVMAWHDRFLRTLRRTPQTSAQTMSRLVG